MCIRIGYADADRLVSYPDVRFLSGYPLVLGASGPFGALQPGRVVVRPVEGAESRF